MTQRAMYVLALCATRRRGADLAGKRVLSERDALGAEFDGNGFSLIERRLIADALVADSADAAKEAGVERVLERCPPEDGWTDHEVTVAGVTREFLIDALQEIDDEVFDDEDADEVVM